MSDPLQGRRSYERGRLDDADLDRDPFEQFRRWLADASEAGTVEANAMALATVSARGVPSVRMVLLRGFDGRGFVFFTNYESAKADDIAATGQAALLFYWAGLERQVRIDGPIEKLPAADSDAYFASRPRGHRLSAWASPQSRELAGRSELEERMRSYDERFGAQDVPRPPHWGGYRVAARRFEFWQGRVSRLHDRFLYVAGEAGWSMTRLAP